MKTFVSHLKVPTHLALPVFLCHCVMNAICCHLKYPLYFFCPLLTNAGGNIPDKDASVEALL